MIRLFDNTDKNYLENLINEDKLQNVYLYIDVKSYGFSGKNIKTFLVEENKKICTILYFYHNSIQLFEVLNISNDAAKEIADYITLNKVKRVSGKVSLIQKICQYIDADYTETDGYIMKYTERNTPNPESICFTDEDDLPEIAKLISEDSHFLGVYEYNDLLDQFKSRLLSDGCENVYIKVDEKIISHFATYALTNDLAVLSGMVTADEYRNKGYGGRLVRFLSEHVVNHGRIAILYCYESPAV